MIRLPTRAEVDQGFEAYEAEMAARRLHPLPPSPRDGDEDRLPRIAPIFCATCGQRFDHANRQVARMLRGRHQKGHSPDTREAF